MQDLHDVGARKFVVVGAGIFGCTPDAISKQGKNGSCVEEQNANAYMFNEKINILVEQLKMQFTGDSKFMFINSTAETIESLGKQYFQFSHTSFNIF